MGRTRQKHFNTAYETQTLDTDQPPPHIFQTLISAMEGPEGLKPPLLKSLYYLLIRLSSNPPICCSNYGAVSNYLGTEISQYGFKVTFKDICNLSDILFRELGKGFKQLFSSLCDVSASRARGQASLQSDTWATAKELNLLLRCCMVILNLLVSDQNLLLEKCQVLLAILGKLCSSDLIGGNEKNAITFKKSVSRECTYSDNGCTTSFAEDFVASLSFLEQSDPCLPFLCSILEVFADELLVHRPLREYFMLIDSVSSTSEMLFTCHSRDGDIGSVLEVISAHFFLSVSDEQAFEHFLNRLYWLHGKNFTVPELSPTAAISLLLHPIMLSAPKVFQAHLISLVSEVIGIGMGPENIRPDLRLMDQYLSAFERSVILYTRHMSSLQMVGHPVGDKGSFDKACKFGRSFQPSFESYIHPVTGNKINRLITKLDNSWHSCLRNMFFRTKSDLVTASIAYIKENQYVLDKSHRDEILSILSCIILRALSGDVGDTVLQNNGDTSPQDIYLLASILKLMSSSMLQAIRCIRHSGNFGYLKTLKDFSSCKEYDFMVGIIGCFRQFSAHLPIQKFLCDMMETHTTRHEESKLMLLHFSGLLSLSFISGLDFLVKGCIFTMMTLMNLFIFEEGNLDALRSLLGSGLESFPSGLSPDKVQEAQVDKKSSLIVASKFQKIQMLYLSTDSLASDHLGTQDGKAEILANASIQNEVCEVGVEEETSNGEIFLKCIQEGSQKSSDFDDLADFIECKQGKNYSGWLKDRQRYRKWKCEKMTVLRWEKKKKTWKFIKGKKT